MNNPSQWGRRFWVITGDGDDLRINADRIEVHESGALIAWGGFRKSDEKEPIDSQIVYSIANKQWHTFYAASIVDSYSVCEEHSAYD